MSKAQEVGERIAQARREKGVRERRDVRPADVARALDVSGATVSDWESGKVTPRGANLERLADYLGVTPAFLLFGPTPTLTGKGRRSIPDPDAGDGPSGRGRAGGE